MKLHNLTILLFALGAFTISGCKDTFKKAFPDNPSTAVSVVGDISDPGLIHVSPQEITSLYSLHDNTLYNGYIYRMHFIGATDNPITQHKVEPASWLWGSEYERIAKLRAFRTQITNEITKLEQQEFERQTNSRILQTLRTEMEYMAQVKAKEKKIVLLSDLYENDSYNMYEPSALRLAEADPEAVAAKLDEIVPLPDVPNLVVFIVFQPKTHEAQVKFEIAAKVFTILLQKHGATVKVAPNLSAHG